MGEDGCGASRRRGDEEPVELCGGSNVRVEIVVARDALMVKTSTP